MDTKKLPIEPAHRLTSMLLDHFIMTLVAMVFIAPVALLNFKESGANNSLFSGGWGLLPLLGFALYFCKDVFQGRSLAKRALKLQLVDDKTGEPADPVNTVIRNFFCFIWPIEVIVALMNTERRIGDRVAGTRLERFDAAKEPSEISYARLSIAILLAVGFVLLIIFGTNELLGMEG